MFHYRTKTRFPIFIAAILALLTCVAQKATSGGTPQDPGAFIAQARALLEAGQELHSLGRDSKALEWLKEQRGRAKWKLALLPLPGKSAAESLAVFYDWHTCESIGDHIHPLVKTPEGWRFGAEIPETDTRGFRVRDHEMTVEYDLPRHGCRITDEVEIERLGENRIGLLRLSADMKVDSIKLGGKEAIATHVPGVIAFEAPEEKTFKINLAYRGTVNHPNSDYILPSEAVLVSYWYPHIGRLPAKLGVTVTVPKGWTAIGQGELRRRESRGSDTVFQYRNEIPTCYFSLDAGPYTITTRTVRGRKYSLCELKPTPGRMERAFSDMIESLEFFEKNFGPYPYTHYEIVETLQPFGGALEAYSFATFQSNTIPGAVVHEVAHTWWGGVVPNPYTRTMWNESFASYSDGLFQRHRARGQRGISGPQSAGIRSPGRALQGVHLDAQKGRGMLQAYRVPINQATDTSSGGHGAVGYGKGSQVLAMLEDLLGTDVMIKCMRRFFRDHVRGEPADWPDFQKAVRSETGKDYGWFFEQWLTRSGVPIVRLAGVNLSVKSGAPMVRGRIVQEGLPYRLRIPVSLEGREGPITREIEVSETETEFSLPAPSGLMTVALDPAGNILMAGASTDERTDPFRQAVSPP